MNDVLALLIKAGQADLGNQEDRVFPFVRMRRISNMSLVCGVYLCCLRVMVSDKAAKDILP